MDILQRLRLRANETQAQVTLKQETLNQDPLKNEEMRASELSEQTNADTAYKEKPTSKTEETGPRTTLRLLINELDERAYGLLLLLLALPCCLPFVYLLPQIVALPMIAICLQLATGKKSPWLPEKLGAREFGITEFEMVVGHSKRYIGWVEIFTRPRLYFLTEGLGLRLIGAGLAIPCASILVPFPLTNTVPGISVALAAIGLIERDGLLTVFGLVCGLFWVFLLVFFGVEGVQLLKEWVTSWV